MMPNTDLSGLLGSKYITMFVDYGPAVSEDDTTYGVRGYSFRATTYDGTPSETASANAIESLRDMQTAGFPAFIILTDKFFYGSIHTDFSEN